MLCVCARQDTAELLNHEELRVTQHQANLDHVSQLDAILAQIKEVEDHENELIQQGLAMEYAVPNQLQFSCRGQPTLSKTSQHPTTCGADHRDSSSVDVPLVLPLGVVMGLDVPGPQPEEWTTSTTSHVSCDTKPSIGDVLSRETLKHVRMLTAPTPTGQTRALSTSVLHGRRYLSIEKRRQKFERHRRLVEASLAGTGMQQWAVVEVYVCSLARARALVAGRVS